MTIQHHGNGQKAPRLLGVSRPRRRRPQPRNTQILVCNLDCRHAARSANQRRAALSHVCDALGIPRSQFSGGWYKSWVNADSHSTDRYPSFELRGPEPPKEAKTAREKAAFWLNLHKEEIANAEANWNVSRIAIAGVIAWEALQNPQAFSVSSSGPGKMHLHGKSGHLSWPEVVERTGRMKSLPEILRKIELQSQMLPSITSAHPLTWQQLLQKSMAWTFAAIQKYLARSTTASRRTSG